MLALALCLVLVAAVQLVCVLALIDQYKGLLQIRASLGLIDTPKHLELPPVTAPLSPSDLGLPAHLDQQDRAIVVFLSTKCVTCRTIGSSLHGQVPNPMWVVVEGPSLRACDQWLAEVGLSKERVTPDADGGIARQLDLEVVPAAAIFENGAFRFAQTLPSFRQLQRLMSSTASQFANIS